MIALIKSDSLLDLQKYLEERNLGRTLRLLIKAVTQTHSFKLPPVLFESLIGRYLSDEERRYVQIKLNGIRNDIMSVGESNYYIRIMMNLNGRLVMEFYNG